MITSFVLNGEEVTVDAHPTRTLLEYLRETRGLTGTKEGCNEGDCGACTVMVTGPNGPRTLNACILLLPQLDGKAVRTVEGLADHPAQSAMVEHHGSQCGFCTPGFVVSMATAHALGTTDHDQTFAGNLCRCTGYAPIVRAAQAIESLPVTPLDPRPALREPSQTLDEFADWYLAHPDTVLVAGATDVGLWVTKQLRDMPKLAFLGRVGGLDQIDETPAGLRIGAGVTITDLMAAVATRYPHLAMMLRRYGSQQVRNAATIGGNIANGSPIGDAPPALIALGARLHLRQGKAGREVALEDYFIAYGKQDRRRGEFVEAITIPNQADHLRVWKVSKRFDQDISAVCGALNIVVEQGRVRSARIAFGGMAGTPVRARVAETLLTGGAWSEAQVKAAMASFDAEFTPMTDMRGSAAYRMLAAKNLLWRYWCADQKIETDLGAVLP